MMTMRVQCPKGCLLSIPDRCSGKIVRCPSCQLVIQIPVVANSETESGVANTIQARRVRSNKNSLATPPRSVKTTGQEPLPEKEPPVMVRQRLSVPAPIRKVVLPPEELMERPPRPANAQNHALIGSRDSGGAPIGADLSAQDDEEQILRQFYASTSDRRILARFYAIFLFCTGIFNLVPAIYLGINSDQLAIDPTWPRWVYLQIFVAGLYFIYAIYLFQLPDWSALRTIAIAMLTLAMLYGFITSGLLIGGGQGGIAQFLMLPNALSNRAAIWCVAMLCLATLISYLTGRESALWCRAEKLLNQILAG